VERLRAKGRQTNIDLSERDKDIDKQERRKRIKESRWRDLEYGNEERKQALDGRGGKKEQNVSEERKTIERKERGEILNEEGREIKWMKEIWKRRKPLP
jgi:hypothetical protein